MLTSKEEFVMFVQESQVKCYQGLPILVISLNDNPLIFLLYCLATTLTLCWLCVVDLDTLAFNHDEAHIYPLYFSYQLPLTDRLGLGLVDDVRGLLF